MHEGVQKQVISSEISSIFSLLKNGTETKKLWKEKEIRKENNSYFPNNNPLLQFLIHTYVPRL